MSAIRILAAILATAAAVMRIDICLMQPTGWNYIHLGFIVLVTVWLWFRAIHTAG